MSSQSPGKHRTGYYRWVVVCTLMFLISVVNFGDRGVLGIVAPVIAKVYHLSPGQLGLVLSAFGFGYVVMQLFFSGIIVRWVQPRRLIAGMGILWSIFLGLVALATSATQIFIFRILFGISEGTNWMSMGSLISRWYSKDETQRAYNIAWAGISVSSIIVPPIAVAVVVAFSWQAPFLLLGLIGIVLGLVFYLLVTDFPEKSRLVSAREKAYITSHRFIPEQGRMKTYRWSEILSSSSGWWAAVGSYATSFDIYFLLTWLPTYLISDRHIQYANVGWLTALPYVFGALGGFMMGPLSDRLHTQKRLFASRIVLPSACAIISGIAFLLINYVPSLGIIIALMSLAAFGTQAANGILGASAIDIYPYEPHMGSQLIVGFGSINAIVAPLIIGIAVGATHNFFTAFLIGGGLPLVIGVFMLFWYRIRPVEPVSASLPTKVISEEAQ